MNILMVSTTFPYPPSKGGTEIRTFNLLKYLKQRHSVTVVTQRHNVEPDADSEALRSWVDELVIFPLRESTFDQQGWLGLLGKSFRLIESFVKATPPNVLYRYSPEMQAWIESRVKASQFQAMTCEHSANAIYVRPSFQGYVRAVVNVHSAVYAGKIKYLQSGASDNRWRDRFYLSTLGRYEKRYCQQMDHIVVTTPDDQAQLQELCPEAKISIIANGVDLDLFPYREVDPGGHHLIFVGAMNMDHNIDAVLYFVKAVMPGLRERYPEATFSIVGTKPVPEVQALAQQPGVVVTGRVPSMVDYLHQATVCVVPLRTGYGIKNKTLEAMAAGAPVVGSDRGLEGLAVDGTELPLRALRANQPSEYIEAIGRLFEDEELRSQLSSRGRDYVAAEFTWDSVGQAYEKVLAGEV